MSSVPVCCSLMLLPIPTHGIVAVPSPTEMSDAHFVLPTKTSIPCRRSGCAFRLVSWMDVTSHVPFRDTCHHGCAAGADKVHVPGQALSGDAMRAFSAVPPWLVELCDAVITLYGISAGTPPPRGRSAQVHKQDHCLVVPTKFNEACSTSASDCYIFSMGAIV